MYVLLRLALRYWYYFIVVLDLDFNDSLLAEVKMIDVRIWPNMNYALGDYSDAIR